MKNQNLIQAFKFLMFSISAGVIQIIVTTIMDDCLGIDYWVSYLTGLVLSVIWNFTFNRKFTFKSANNVPFAMFLVALYYCAFTPLSTWWGNAMEGAGLPGIFVTVFSMSINFVTEFLYQKFVVFRGTVNSAVNCEEEKFKKIIKLLKEEF